MGTYAVTGVKVAKNGVGKVTSASDASLSIFFQGADSGFTYSYDTSIKTSHPTPASLSVINSQMTLHGQSLTTGFDVGLGSTTWRNHTVQILEVYDRATHELFYFQLQGGPGSAPITSASEWASLLNSRPAFDASAFSEGSVIYPGQFERDNFSDDDKLTLGAGKDNVDTGGGKDIIYSGDGNDTITTSSGHDSLYGGNGDDTFIFDTSLKATASQFLDANQLSGGNGEDTLAFDLSGLNVKASFTIDLTLGTAIYDGLGHTATKMQSVEDVSITGAISGLHSVVINGSTLANVIDLDGGTFDSIKITAGAGNDKVIGLSGNATVDGGLGNDTITMTAGSLHALGGDGDDVIRTNGLGDSFESGGAGNDNLHGGGGADKLLGDLGNDTLYGMDGQDSIYGGDGADSISGGDGQDLIYGGLGDDVIYGGDGDDSLFGSDGNDTIKGVSGQDSIEGGAGDDSLVGGDGNRVDIHGGDGRDTIIAGGTTIRPDDPFAFAVGEAIYGDRGNDILTGNYGHDTLDGGEGYDLLQGFVLDESGLKVGDGQRDVFVLSGPVLHGPISIADKVTYFEHGVDKLDLSALGIAMRLTNDDFTRDRIAKLHYEASTGLLTADLEGKGKIGWMAEVHTIDHTPLTNGDFLF